MLQLTSGIFYYKLADLIWIHDWIKNRKDRDPTWEIPENTEDFLNGIESDMELLSEQLGIDLSLYVILPKQFKP